MKVQQSGTKDEFGTIAEFETAITAIRQQHG
jgi:hypothetical protein